MMIRLLQPACSVCFGDPNALSSKAVWPAVFFLLAVVIFVLSAIAWNGFVWAKRDRQLSAQGPT